MRRTAVSTTLAERCASFAARLHGETFFCERTAALLRGCPLPWRVENDRRIHVGVAAPRAAPHANGLVGHSIRLQPDDVTMLGGLRVASAELSWCELGAVLDLPNLVAVGDHLVHHRFPHVTTDELRDAVERWGRRRGARRLRKALALLDPYAESRPESIVRVLIVEAGLPRPIANHTIVDPTTGRVFRADLAFIARRVIVEYQGDHHRDRAQWRADLRRRARLEALGWRILELGAEDLERPADFLAHLAALLAP